MICAEKNVRVGIRCFFAMKDAKEGVKIITGRGRGECGMNGKDHLRKIGQSTRREAIGLKRTEMKRIHIRNADFPPPIAIHRLKR